MNRVSVAGPERRVVVIDRQPAFAEALATMLRTSGWSATSTTMADAQAAITYGAPGLALVDGDGPVADVETCVAALRASGATVLLLVGPRVNAAQLVRRTGAVGCVSRQESGTALLDALRRVRAGRAPLRITTPARTTRPSLLSYLTRREIEVLQALMAGLRSPAIAAELDISPHTVRTHVQNILAKLGVHTRLEAVTLAMRAGLRPTSDPLQFTGTA